MTTAYVPAAVLVFVRRRYDGTVLILFWNVLTEVDRPPLAMDAKLPVAAASALIAVAVAVGVRVAPPVPEPPTITVEPFTPISMMVVPVPSPTWVPVSAKVATPDAICVAVLKAIREPPLTRIETLLNAG